MPEFAICALATKNYSAQAETMLASVRAHHPEIDIFFLIVDAPPDHGETLRVPKVTILHPTEVIEHVLFWERVCRYDPFELCNSLKPVLIAHVLGLSYDKVVYLDVDVLVMQPLHEIVDVLDEANIVLTPHIISSMPDDGYEPNERTLLKSGVFNAGSLAVRNTAESLRFLTWWDAKLARYCLNKQNEGLFVDQKWLDLVPTMFLGVHVLRHPGYNVAHWNLHERELSYREGQFLVNEQRLVFFHFSGFDPLDVSQVSKHRSRPLAEPSPALDTLLASYAALWLTNGFEADRQVHYGLRQFRHGVPLDDRSKRLLIPWLNDGHAGADPLDVDAPGSFYAWLNNPVDADVPGCIVTNYLMAIYRERPDVQAHFPDVLGQHQADFLTWVSDHRTELAVACEFFLQEANQPSNGSVSLQDLATNSHPGDPPFATKAPGLLLCPLCQSDKLITQHTIFTPYLNQAYMTSFGVDVRRFYPSEHMQILMCMRCSLKHFSPALSGDSDFYNALRSYQSDKPEFDFALAQIARAQPERILEYGCGEGHFLQKLQHAYDVRGTEFNASAIAKLTQTGIQLDQPTDRYDFIVAFQVMGRLTDVRALLSTIVEKLNPGGRLLVTVPNTESNYAREVFDALDHPPHHMTQWSRQALEEIAAVFFLDVENYFAEPPRLGHYRILHQTRRAQLMTGGRSDQWLRRFGGFLDTLLMPYFLSYIDYPGRTHGMVFRKPLPQGLKK